MVINSDIGYFLHGLLLLCKGVFLPGVFITPGSSPFHII
jgi:hypothetical protein